MEVGETHWLLRQLVLARRTVGVWSTTPKFAPAMEMALEPNGDPALSERLVTTGASNENSTPLHGASSVDTFTLTLVSKARVVRGAWHATAVQEVHVVVLQSNGLSPIVGVGSERKKSPPVSMIDTPPVAGAFCGLIEVPKEEVDDV